MSREKLRVYISGPITGTTDHMERFAEVEKKLTEAGVEVLNPARMGAQLPETFTHAEHLEVDVAALKQCDAIYMMDGWQNSQGARREFIEAKQNGILVFNKDEIVELSRIAGRFADQAATAVRAVTDQMLMEA